MFNILYIVYFSLLTIINPFFKKAKFFILSLGKTSLELIVIEQELFTNIYIYIYIYMHLFTEDGIRGGVIVIRNRFGKANLLELA